MNTLQLFEYLSEMKEIDMNHYPFMFGESFYSPISPVPDNDELAKQKRIILYHDKAEGPRMFWVEAGNLHAGWVIGVAS